MKILIKVSNRFYAKALDEFYTHADLIDGMNAIRDGQILPDGCEILTKEAYTDLCMRAAKASDLDDIRAEIDHIIPCGKEALSIKLGILEIIHKYCGGTTDE